MYSVLNTKAEAELAKEIEAELEKEDPEEAKAEKVIAENETESE